MTREEAINKIRWVLFGLVVDKDIHDAFEMLIPELREPEDEKIRKELVEKITNLACGCFISQEQKQKFIAYLEKQKEQKPNIELIQRSWYLEGYHDREFGKEPMWIITTGKDGPKYELNPKYGKKLAKEQKSAWSEEDEKMLDDICSHLYATSEERSKMQNWLKSLHLQPKAEWSEEEHRMLDNIEKIIYCCIENSPVGFTQEYLKDLGFFVHTIQKKSNIEKWNEEDEEIIADAIKQLYSYANSYHNANNDIREKEVRKIADGLKSIRPQLKQEWSNEDESCWNLIWDILDGPFVASKESFKKAAAWFLKNCPKGTKFLNSNKQD